MPERSYPVEVQSDFLEQITRAKPLHAVAEFIWNGLDADATSIAVRLYHNAMGGLSQIVIQDDGTAMEFATAHELFQRLGGSWKRSGGTTHQEHRFLHGQDGRGRFKAFALARVAEWDVTYEREGKLWTFRITMKAADMKRVVISDEIAVASDARRGVTLTLSEVNRDYSRSLTSMAALQELTEIFALYLTNYPHVSVFIESSKIDPGRAIASRASVDLPNAVEDGDDYPVRLETIEWQAVTNRALYLCNEKGFPLAQADRRFHVGSFQFSAYLKSEYIAKLHREGTLELAEMRPASLTDLLDQAQGAIRDYFRGRGAQDARAMVEQWKQEQVYPYAGDATTSVEQVERQVFDIVAVNVAQHLPEFATTATTHRAFHLRMLRQAIEKSPEDLQIILKEVLQLPARKQTELAGLLRDVSLSAIISAAKLVADRLRFLTGLEAVLYDTEPKKRLRERGQLHRILAQNSWVFGEEFNLSADNRSLTEVLRKHWELQGRGQIAIDEPVRHVSKKLGIIDLMLSRVIQNHKADEFTHLVVELKAPSVKIGTAEITQTEEYAISVMKDERFRSVNTTWVFWAISDDYNYYAEHRMRNFKGGKVYESGTLSIWVKTWAQVLAENRARLNFFKAALEYEADKGASLRYLHEHYAKHLQGVVVEDADADTDDDSARGAAEADEDS